MGRQVVEYDHVARHQRRAEHLVQVGGKHVPVDDPTHGHRRVQTRWGQGGHQRHVRHAVPGRSLVGSLPAFGAGVAPAIGQVRARLVHELETSDILGL